MDLVIPQESRQSGPMYNCTPGLDLPASFLDNLRAIDPDIYPIFHKWEVLWDDLMNGYFGEIDDPRFTISMPSGFSELLWGYPTKQAEKDAPVEDGHWHLWRLCRNAGAWAHIVKIEDKNPQHLQLIIDRLFFQANYRDRYGNKAWNEKIREEQDNERASAQKQAQNDFNDIQKENSWLMRNAMAELERGNFKPTNPTVEKIVSYSGQKNFTKTVRPLEDEDTGLIIPGK